MNTLKLTTFILGLTLLFGNYSCKYEEGPGISLRTKKARITGSWNVEKITEEDGDIFRPDNNNSIKYTFNKSGTGDRTIKLLGFTSDQTLNWELRNSKSDLQLVYKNGDIDYVKILRLTDKELVVLNSDNDKWELEKQ